MTPDEELQALTYAIARLESELRRSLAPERHKSIVETLDVLRDMQELIAGELRDGRPTI